jgi:hypothetical protein
VCQELILDGSAGSCSGVMTSSTTPQTPQFSSAEHFSSYAFKPSTDLRESVRNKDIAGVREWLVDTVGISTKNADILVAQEVNGRQLLKVTKEELVKLYGMPGGPAGEIVDAVAGMASPLGAAATGARFKAGEVKVFAFVRKDGRIHP